MDDGSIGDAQAAFTASAGKAILSYVAVFRVRCDINHLIYLTGSAKLQINSSVTCIPVN